MQLEFFDDIELVQQAVHLTTDCTRLQSHGSCVYRVGIYYNEACGNVPYVHLSAASN